MTSWVLVFILATGYRESSPVVIQNLVDVAECNRVAEQIKKTFAHDFSSSAPMKFQCIEVNNKFGNKQ